MSEDKYKFEDLHKKPFPEDEESAGRVDWGNDGDAWQVQDENQAGRPRYPQYSIQVNLFQPILW